MMLLHPAIIMFCSYFRLPTRQCLTPLIRKSSSLAAHQTLLTMDQPGERDASTLFLLRQKEPKKNIYTLSDMLCYLNQIQDILEASPELSSPAMRYDHCQNTGNSNTFFKVVGNVLAKPMLRSLIYNDQISWQKLASTSSKKIYFDQRIREEKAGLEFDNMYSFVMNTLRPAALELDEDLRTTFIPDLLNQIDLIEKKLQEKEDTGPRLLKWNGLFRRLATGRYYQGKLEAMISDLFPHHMDEFVTASRKVTEREVLERVIQLDLIDVLNSDESAKLSEEERAWMKRRINATKICLDSFYTATDEGNENFAKQDHLDGITSGKKCEQSCLEFLQDVYYGNDDESNGTNTRRILTNVYINNRRKPYSELGQKYIPPKMHRRGSSPKQKELGIIWTDADSSVRHRECSELDAVILNLQGVSFTNTESVDNDMSMGTMVTMDNNATNNNCTAIESIFEAKRTISPSTLHDIIYKKLGAIEALLDDSNSELAYRNGEGMMGSAPISSDTTPSFTFGIYGVELLPPGNAADSIRSIAGSNIVSSNITEVICALERGSYRQDSSVMVEVEVASTIEIVENLKSVIEEKMQDNRVDIVFILEEKASFLQS